MWVSGHDEKSASTVSFDTRERNYEWLIFYKVVPEIYNPDVQRRQPRTEKMINIDYGWYFRWEFPFETEK